jgi:hypothetical protein
MHLFSCKTIVLKLFVRNCHFVLIVFHPQDASLNQVEEIVLIFGFTSAA